MNRAERAKQFLPFDALKGLQDELKIREERLTCVEKAELTEEACERLSSILATLNKGDFVSVTFYFSGKYLCAEGQVGEINPTYRYLKLGDFKIPFGDIKDIGTKFPSERV